MSNGQHQDPDEFFAHTRMGFGDHIEELRRHLWRALIGFGIALVFSIFIGKYVLEFIKAPVQEQLERFRDRRNRELMATAEENAKARQANIPTKWVKMAYYKPQLEAVLKGDTSKDFSTRPEDPPRPDSKAWYDNLDPNLWISGSTSSTPEDEKKYVKPEEKVHVWVQFEDPYYLAAGLDPSMRHLQGTDEVATLRAEEAFLVFMKVCMGTALVLGSPWIFWQLWSFVAAGLYPHEKKLVHYYLPFSLILFIGGVLLCEFLVLPQAISALLWFNHWLGLKPDLRLNEWMGFAVLMPILFGLAFQTPLVMLFTEKIGVMTPDHYRKWRRYIYFGMLLLAALVLPSTDPFSLLFMWVPMVALYELGIRMCEWSARKSRMEDIDVTDPAETVEV